MEGATNTWVLLEAGRSEGKWRSQEEAGRVRGSRGSGGEVGTVGGRQGEWGLNALIIMPRALLQ